MRKGFGIFFCFLIFVLAGRDLRAETRIFWMAQGPMASDFDGNGVVGFTDFLIFVNSFNTQSGDETFDPRVDLDGDGTVNFSDFLSFSASFGQRQTAPSAPQPDYVVYVADSDDSSVMVFDFNTHLLIDYLPFRAPGSIRVSRDQQSIYVSEVFGFFQMNTQHLINYSLPTDSRGTLVLSPDEKWAYVTDQTNDLLRVIDLVGQVTVDTIAVGDRPIDLAVTPDGKKLYVVNQVSRDVSVVDLDQGTTVGQIVIGAIPGEIEITPDGRRAYVTNLDRGVISVLDLTANRVAGAIQLDEEASFGAEFSPDGKTLYVSAQGSLLAIDVQRNLIFKTLRVADNTSVLGISPDGTRAYIASFQQLAGGPGLTAVDLTNWRVMGWLRGFLFPRQIAFRALPALGGPE